ncbi:MAG: crossover junction endodeoxyribonuclease RuvC [Bacteroidota bacterium]|nr:crossover junction endodeoxyribonuclease RuvC [Bacteroidota bacterium]
MRIIGIDPGTNITGIGIVEHRDERVYLIHYNTINLNSKEPLPARLKKIYDECLQCINEYKPDEFAIETAFYGKNIQSTLKLGQARGVAIIAALNSNLKISEYSPREVKKSVTGNGASSKVQVQYMVRSILALSNGSDVMEIDSSDALAVALCHYYCSGNILSNRNLKSGSNSWKFFADQNPERIIIKKK